MPAQHFLHKITSSAHATHCRCPMPLSSMGSKNIWRQQETSSVVSVKGWSHEERCSWAGLQHSSNPAWQRGKVAQAHQ